MPAPAVRSTVPTLGPRPGAGAVRETVDQARTAPRTEPLKGTLVELLKVQGVLALVLALLALAPLATILLVALLVYAFGWIAGGA